MKSLAPLTNPKATSKFSPRLSLEWHLVYNRCSRKICLINKDRPLPVCPDAQLWTVPACAPSSAPPPISCPPIPRSYQFFLLLLRGTSLNRAVALDLCLSAHQIRYSSEVSTLCGEGSKWLFSSPPRPGTPSVLPSLSSHGPWGLRPRAPWRVPGGSKL